MRPCRCRITQGGRDGRAEADTFAHRQPVAFGQVVRKRARLIKIGMDGLAGANVVAQFHHVIKIIRLGIAAHLQHIHQPVVLAGKRLEFQYALEFILKRLLPVERPAEDDFDRAISAQRVPGQPHFAAAARANQPDELMLGHHRLGRGFVRRVGRRVHAKGRSPVSSRRISFLISALRRNLAR